MKTQRPWPYVTITAKGENALSSGHPWVYEGEIVTVDEAVRDGELCDVFSQKHKYLGTGFYNSHSLLRVRVISDNANDLFDNAFWTRRLQYAVDYRLRVMGGDAACCRLIFGEADFFPGLTVDLFTDMLVAEVQNLGIDRIKHKLFPLLKDVLLARGIAIRGLFERSEGGIRQKEGLTDVTGFFPFDGLPTPDSGLVSILENGVRYVVDIVKGQKTGFFLDQKYNRLQTAKLARDLTVLDCFTHTGSFGLNCLKHGAKSVVMVDASQEALDKAQENARLNGFESKVSYVKADALKWLPEQVGQNQKYDLVILDPPAFAKHRKAVLPAQKGYRDINAHGMRLTRRGGYLATCTCSHFMPRDLFEKAVMNAAQIAGVRLRLIESRGQSPDHPILMNVPETEYLKFYIFQVL